jgi:hypothetical protein
MAKIKTIFMMVLAVLLSIFVSFNHIFAQNANPRLYPVSDEKCLIVWRSDNAIIRYLAQFILKNSELEGINFPIYSKELITFNSLTDFMVTKTYQHPGDEYFDDSFSVHAKIYHSITDTTNTFFLTHNYWPWCGMDFLGFEEILIGLGENFLYVNQFDGYLSSQRFQASGERISTISGTQNACHITVDCLPDESYLIIWFSGRYYPYTDMIPYGIYATFIENNEIRADSILIKEYPHFPEYVIDSNHDLIPTFRIKALNDTTYQLFVVEPDSLYLYSYYLSREAEIKKTKRFSIPNVYHYSDSMIPYVRALNISNFTENNRALFLSTLINENESRYVTNYLYYFTDEGSFSSGPVMDTTQLFQTDYFQFKTGPETFLNPSEKGNDIMIDTYHNFFVIDSHKIGNISSVENKNNFNPTQFYLNQNFPNPFNPTTVISWQLQFCSEVDLSIYNPLGQKVATLVSEWQTTGYYKVEWDATGYASGVYYYRIQAGEFQDVKKMVLIR